MLHETNTIGKNPFNRPINRIVLDVGGIDSMSGQTRGNSVHDNISFFCEFCP